MPVPLRAIVIGAGFAGEGHTLALRHAGVDVVAICARRPAVVQRIASGLGVPEASTDWRRTLASVRPDIVSVATPASVHREIIEAAAAQGCHLYSDKPLATSAADARHLYDLVERAGVRHALAATHRYDASVAWLAELLRQGTIGTLMEIEGTFRRRVPALYPWTWYDTVATGGGLLHNAFPHWLGILMTATGGHLRRVAGEARTFRHRAPVVPALSDFRDRSRLMPSSEAAAALEWRACDADNAFSVLLQFTAAPEVASDTVAITLVASGADAHWPPNGWRFHGDTGTLLVDGHFSYTLALQRSGRTEERVSLPVPDRLVQAVPALGEDTLDKWAALALAFVADIQGKAHQPYLTFRDGWRFQEAIDAIRAGRGWFDVPE